MKEWKEDDYKSDIQWCWVLYIIVFLLFVLGGALSGILFILKFIDYIWYD